MLHVHRSDAIYPVQVKTALVVDSWRDWPDDVQATLRIWSRDRKLHFEWSQAPAIFKCWDCGAFCSTRQNGAAVIGRFQYLCGECLIVRIRLFDTQGD